MTCGLRSRGALLSPSSFRAEANIIAEEGGCLCVFNSYGLISRDSSCVPVHNRIHYQVDFKNRYMDTNGFNVVQRLKRKKVGMLLV